MTEGYEGYRSCKRDGIAGQGSVDDNQGGAKDFRFRGLGNYGV